MGATLSTLFTEGSAERRFSRSRAWATSLPTTAAKSTSWEEPAMRRYSHSTEATPFDCRFSRL